MTQRHRDCPGWLDEDACSEWRRLQESGLAGMKDPETVAAYCFTSAMWARMRAIIDQLPDEGQSGWVTRGGQERPHPALEIESRLAADLLELSDALDLEPSGREAPSPSRVLFLD